MLVARRSNRFDFCYSELLQQTLCLVLLYDLQLVSGFSKEAVISALVASETQSHYREVMRWEILMEQKLRFWQSAPAQNLGSTESTCMLLPNLY